MISFCCDIWGIIVIYILFFVERDTNKRSLTLAKFRTDLKLFPQYFLSHWHRMLVPRPSVVLSHIRLILSAPRVSNVCQPHQIFWISWSLGFLSSKDFLQFAENERWSVPFFLGASFEIVSITPASYIHNTHIYKHVFQIMSLLYVMYARCPHIIGIVMCPLHVFCHMPYFRLSYITGHVISTCLSWFMGLSRKSVQLCYETLLSFFPGSPFIMCWKVTHSDTVTVDEIGISRMNVI